MPSLLWTGRLSFPMRVMVDANKLLALKAFQIGAWQEVCGEISSVGCDQDKIGLSFPPNFMHQS